MFLLIETVSAINETQYSNVSAISDRYNTVCPAHEWGEQIN